MVAIFYDIDAFGRSVLVAPPRAVPRPSGSPSSRGNRLTLSESMTMLVWFPVPHYRTCQHF